MFDLEDIKKKVSIEPKFNGGANFETHVLSKTKTGFKFKPSIVNALFTGAFGVTGYGFVIFGIYKYFKFENFKFSDDYLIAIVGILFFIIANILLYIHFSPIIFDKTTNRFYKGFNKFHPKKSTKLSNIVALQVLGETIRSSDSNYKSFELNLVLKDASRINVVDHGKLKTLLDDAEVLSQYFNLPIWHAETGKK